MTYFCGRHEFVYRKSGLLSMLHNIDKMGKLIQTAVPDEKVIAMIHLFIDEQLFIFPALNSDFLEKILILKKRAESAAVNFIIFGIDAAGRHNFQRTGDVIRKLNLQLNPWIFAALIHFWRNIIFANLAADVSHGIDRVDCGAPEKIRLISKRSCEQPADESHVPLLPEPFGSRIQ